jgi:wobble nucleotide-excising tRNase
MNNEYIIVNKTAIQKRIEELERQIKESSIEETGEYDFQCEDKIEELNLVLSQSTPLIPEIDKAFDAGSERCEFGYGNANDKQDYITNLKLDI